MHTDKTPPPPPKSLRSPALAGPPGLRLGTRKIQSSKGNHKRHRGAGSRTWQAHRISPANGIPADPAGFHKPAHWLQFESLWAPSSVGPPAAPARQAQHRITHTGTGRPERHRRIGTAIQHAHRQKLRPSAPAGTSWPLAAPRRRSAERCREHIDGAGQLSDPHIGWDWGQLSAGIRRVFRRSWLAGSPVNTCKPGSTC